MSNYTLLFLRSFGILQSVMASNICYIDTHEKKLKRNEKHKFIHNPNKLHPPVEEEL